MRCGEHDPGDNCSPWLHREGTVGEADLTNRQTNKKSQFPKWEFHTEFLSSAPTKLLCWDDPETDFCRILCKVGFYIYDSHQVILFLGTGLFCNGKKDCQIGVLAIIFWRKTTSKHSRNTVICPNISLVLIHPDCYLCCFTVWHWFLYAYNSFLQI